MVMNGIRFTSPSGGTELLLHKGNGRRYSLVCPFLPLEQPEFVDSIHRVLDLDRVEKPERGGCVLYFSARSQEQQENIVEIIEEIFTETHREV